MDRELAWVVSVIAAFFVLLGCFFVFAAHKEAETYNRLTGAHVTTWDAMWVELRVQEGTRRDQ